MKLIFAEDDDETANIVCKWLLFNSISFTRVNVTDDVDLKSLTISNTSDVSLKLNNIPDLIISQSASINHKFWFRRGFIKITNKKLNINSIPNIANNKNTIHELVNHAKSEFDSLGYGIYTFINREKISTSNPLYYSANKIETLLIAKELGINIPNTIITSSKKEVVEFYTHNHQLITKGIQEICLLENGNEILGTYTSEVSFDFINSLPEKFKPTLFQKKIDKKFEIRTFYCKGMTYSMAIFSQSDEQTMLDYRRYNLKNPNRMVPYMLPNHIITKLASLMEKLNIDNGSIDFIYSGNNEYVLLEVNPVGQIGFLSIPNNYNIEEFIALNI